MEACLIGIDHLGIPGDIVECGVWRGGNIILARIMCPDRVCWLYDTFAGMPPPGPYDAKHKPGRNPYLASAHIAKKKSLVMSLATLDEVIDCFRAEGLLDFGRMNFVKGKVEDSLFNSQLPERIALLRLDTDWYESTKVELEVLYPRLVSGGYLIIDDYGHWLGARKAVDDYFKANNIDTGLLKTIDYTAVYMVKP